MTAAVLSAGLVIAALGDSTTAGTPYYRSQAEAPPAGEGDPRGSYAYWVLQERRDWRVANLGVAGERSDQIAKRFERQVLPLKPAIVVILAGVNDVYQGYPRDHTARELRRMIAWARDAGIEPVLGTVLPFDRATKEQAAAIRALNNEILRISRKEKLRLCDFNRAARRPREPDLLRGSPDGLHPDIETAKAMGQALVRSLVRQ